MKKFFFADINLLRDWFKKSYVCNGNRETGQMQLFAGSHGRIHGTLPIFTLGAKTGKPRRIYGPRTHSSPTRDKLEKFPVIPRSCVPRGVILHCNRAFSSGILSSLLRVLPFLVYQGQNVRVSHCLICSDNEGDLASGWTFFFVLCELNLWRGTFSQFQGLLFLRAPFRRCNSSGA